MANCAIQQNEWMISQRVNELTPQFGEITTKKTLGNVSASLLSVFFSLPIDRIPVPNVKLCNVYSVLSQAAMIF